jgi:tetratricopeptide (TPR) repeat protein
MAQMFGKAADRLKAHLADQESGDASTQIKLVLARMLYCQARYVFELTLPEQVEALCKECLAIWPSAGHDSEHVAERAHVQLLLSNAVYDQGRYDESERICHAAWRDCQVNRDQVGLQFAYLILGYNAFTRGNSAQAQQMFTQSLAIANDLGEQVQKVFSLGMLGEVLCNQGEIAAAQQVAWEANQISETFGCTLGIAGSYILLGYAAFVSGQLAQARHRFQSGLTLFEEVGAEFGRLNSRRWLGNTAYRQHDYAAARRFFDESLALARTHPRPVFVAIALTGLGNVACALGEYNTARQHFQQALDILQATHAVPDLLHTLAGLSQLWMQMGHVEPAACLLAFTQHHPALLPYTRTSVVQALAELQAKLPDARFTAVCAAGTAMTLEDAIAFVSEMEADN